MQTRAQAAPLVFSLGMAGFVVLADNFVISPILPAIARDVGVSPVRAGVLIASYMLPYALFQLVFGPLADRYGKLPVLRICLIGFTVAAAANAFGTTLSDLTAFRALTGIFAAATVPISLAIIGDTVRLEDRQSAIGTFMGISFLGQGLSMGIGGAIAFFLSWREVFLAYAGLSAVVTGVLISRTRDSVSSGNPRSQFIAPYTKLLREGRSLRVYLIVLLEGVLIVGSFSYLGAFLSSRHDLDNMSIGLVTMAFGIAAVVAGRQSGAVAGRIGRQRTLVAGLVLAALGDGALSGGGNILLVAIVAIASLGAGFMLAQSTLMTLATEFAARARGSAMSLVAFCMMSGGSIGAAVGGRVIESTNFTTFYGLSSALLLTLAGLAALAVTSTRAPVVLLRHRQPGTNRLGQDQD